MQSYWLKFNGHPAGCVEAPSKESATEIAAACTGADVVSCERIPYPSSPRINTHVDEKWGVCPSFCHSPTQCAGRTACPQRYSCTE